jgi:hypothetical protein
MSCHDRNATFTTGASTGTKLLHALSIQLRREARLAFMQDAMAPTCNAVQ